MLPITDRKIEKILGLDVFQRFPKVELHVHLDGSLRPDTVLELAREQGVDLGVYDADALREAVQPPSDPPSLPRYIAAFDTLCAVLGTTDALERVAYELVVDHAAENVRYVEVRYSTRVLPPTIDPDDAIAAVWRGLERGMSEFDIIARQILCVMRHEDAAKGLDVAQSAAASMQLGVVALDAAGAERGHPPAKHRAAFDHARSAGLRTTIHAGEDGPASYVKEAVALIGASRVGHGTHLVDDAHWVRCVADQRVCVEACLTSNVQTGAIDKLADHPLRAFLAAGVPVTLCTDNTTVSAVSLSEEWRTAAQTFDLTWGELRQMLEDGLDATFLPLAERRALKERVLAEFDATLADLGSS